MKQRLKRLVKVLLMVLAILLIADIAAMAIYYRIMMNFTDNNKDNYHVDAAIVFYGDSKKGALLGEDTKKRADKTLEIFNDGKADYIICVGGFSNYTRKYRMHPVRRYLYLQGVDTNLVFNDSSSFNTITNWREALRIMKANNFTSAVCVSAPWHTFRIASMIDNENILFDAYDYSPSGIDEYLKLTENIHHEFVSLTLNALMDDERRNRFVRWYRRTF